MKVTCLQVLEGHTGKVWNCSWNPKGTILATCGEDTNIRLWGRDGDKGNWTLKAILTEGHTRTVRSVGWSPCGRYLASASFDGTVAVWDRKDSEDGNNQFECNATLEGHENEVKSVTWSPSGNFLATCSRDKSVWVWDVDEDEDADGGNEYMCAAVLQSHTQDVKRVCWHPHLDILASCSYDNRIKLFKEDGDEWSCCDTLSSHESTVWAIAFDSSGERLASCSEDKTFKIWEQYKDESRKAWKCACTVSGQHERAIYDLDWCRNTGLLVTGGGDNTIRIFKEANKPSAEGEISFKNVFSADEAHSQDVNCVKWNPKVEGDETELLLASCSDDGTVKLWRVQIEGDDQAD